MDAADHVVPRRRSQGGFALLTVLLILGVVTLVTTALLGLLFTSIAIESGARTSERELRALDGAMDAAINELRFDFNSASRQACELEPPVERVEQVTFDNDTPDPVDDTVVQVDCEGSVNTGRASTADQVRLVGAGGYSSASIPWTTSAWWPASVQPAIAASTPNLVHRGPAPLQFGTGVTVRNTAAVVRDAPADRPAVSVAGEYVQGAPGPGATAGSCGELAVVGPMQIEDLLGTSTPECDVADLELDDDPTGSIAGFPRPTTLPTSIPDCGAAVVTLVPGRYNASNMANLNRLVDRTAPGAGSCPARTFHFTPGVYVFTGDVLVFDRPDSFFVMGEPAWTGGGAVPAALVSDPLAELCNTAASGVTFVLPPQFRLEHRAGRLSMCPAFSPNAGQPALPAVYQETSYANRLLRTPAWSKTFRTALPGACVDSSLDIAPPPDSGRLDVIDGPGVGARPGEFAAADRLPAVGTDRCRIGRTHTVRVDTVDPRPLTSARLTVRGYESLLTPANLISDRRIMVTVRKANRRICTTSAQPGIGNGKWSASVDLLTGSCAAPRDCNFFTGLVPRCHDPRTGILFLGAYDPNQERALTSALLADAQLEITQYLTFATVVPVPLEQTYTIEDVQLVTNDIATATLDTPVNGSESAPRRRGFDNVAAVATAPGDLATPRMPPETTISASFDNLPVLTTPDPGAACRHMLCPIAVPEVLASVPFVHEVDVGRVQVPVPAEYRSVGVEPKLSDLRLRLDLRPEYCPGEPGDRCPFLAPITIPLFGAVDANDVLRQSYFGTDMTIRVKLATHAGTLCVDTPGTIGVDQAVSIDLLDPNRAVTGPGCDDGVIDTLETLEDLRAATDPSADGLNEVDVGVEFRLPCLRDYFGNSSWKCVNFNAEGVGNVVFQVRPPSIGLVSLEVSSDTITVAPATSRITVDARTPGADPSSTSFNVYGRVWLPRSNLDVFWQGDVTEGRPLVRDELVVGALGSQITAPPVRDQTDIPATDRYLVCCDAARSESRDVRLIATAPSGRRLRADVHFVDVVDGDTNDATRYFPGYRVEIRDWQTCEDGRCDP